MLPLTELEVLIVDCQATAASTRGHLMEVGWATAGARAGDAADAARNDAAADAGASAGVAVKDARACLIKLPEGERVPFAVARITGISESMLHEGIEPAEAWRALLDQAQRLAQQPAPTVVHFARFERPFLHALAGDRPPALDLVCTHDIAQRLLPDLPRRGLRALTGYFGRDLGALRRSAEHVEATAFVWRELVRLLDAQGITTWDALRDWLATPSAITLRPGQQRRRVWPMPRDVRLAAPDAPGLYRMQRTDGSILYVGKASSLRSRVNSYFRKQRGVPDRLLEMLSQARALTFEVTESTLEAALLEPDEIKRHRPPYNIALMEEKRHIWFTTRDLGERSAQPSAQHPIGPFTSAMTLDRFAALANASPTALGLGPDTPDARVFAEGYARLCAAHPELSPEAPREHLRVSLREQPHEEAHEEVREDLCEGPNPRIRLLRLGTRLWREGRRDRDNAGDEEFRLGDDVMPEDIQSDLERVALRAALARRRAKWMTRLVDAAIVWQEPGADRARLIVIEHGEIITRAWIDPGTTPPVPPGHARRRDARHEEFLADWSSTAQPNRHAAPAYAGASEFTVARFDRLRVLMTELKRLLAEGAPVALRLGERPALSGARLAAALSWV